ncbi:MAG: hypothetical protein ACLT8E_11935 [Akkermansia sp.]
MMQDSEVIKLVKPVPSDRLATQVLVAWYHAVRPRWKNRWIWPSPPFQC